ncbi:MAG: N-acetylmuramic acid 6-phosphate etherase [Candidatus Hydrogenedens sp.]|nr:N-acetylmuramic acid 6-phosphate etherase [Candidatus Hydrogenedens sp.]
MGLQPEYWIAIEAGGTHSRGGCFDARGQLLREAEGGPCNPMAYGWEASIDSLAALAQSLLPDVPPESVALAAGVAGLVDHAAYVRMGEAIAGRLGLAGARVADDLYPMLYANAGGGAAVLAIGGTGSNVLAMNADGRTAQAGGRGHVFGDEGSAYAIGVSALRAASHAVDGMAPDTRLVDDLMQAAGVTDFRLMVPWAGQATKRDIAALTHVVVRAADAGDAAAAQCIIEQAHQLVAQVLAAVHRLGLQGRVPVLGQGGLFEQCARYADAFEEALSTHGDFNLVPLKLRGPGAIYRFALAAPLPAWAGEWERGTASTETSLPGTESASEKPPLDSLDAAALARVLLQEGVHAAESAVCCTEALAHAIEAGGKALREGGRIMYFGAGTSGRLGVLDASECPPTFGVSPDRVVGRIAGGEAALTRSKEGAEDDCVAGAREAAELGVSPSDFVVGIAASGSTPYVLGALEAARDAGATTALVSANPGPEGGADIAIVLRTGAEILAGSTRLKAGTATKIALNAITTGAFSLAGFVYQGRMVGMMPTNEKLRQRAIRMVAELAEVPAEPAEEALDAAAGNIPVAVLLLRHGLSAEAARARFDAASAPADALR